MDINYNIALLSRGRVATLVRQYARCAWSPNTQQHSSSCTHSARCSLFPATNQWKERTKFFAWADVRFDVFESDVHKFHIHSQKFSVPELLQYRMHQYSLTALYPAQHVRTKQCWTTEMPMHGAAFDSFIVRSAKAEAVSDFRSEFVDYRTVQNFLNTVGKSLTSKCGVGEHCKGSVMPNNYC